MFLWHLASTILGKLDGYHDLLSPGPPVKSRPKLLENFHLKTTQKQDTFCIKHFTNTKLGDWLKTGYSKQIQHK